MSEGIFHTSTILAVAPAELACDRFALIAIMITFQIEQAMGHVTNGI